MGWQPAETAPKDGTPILACFGYGDEARMNVVVWANGYKGETWYEQGLEYEMRRFNHWKHLDKPPERD